MANATDTRRLYRNIREGFGGEADRFVANFAEALVGIDKTDMAAVANLIDQVGSDLNDEIHADAMDDAYQDDIDSGWAAERYAAAGY